MKRRTKHVPCIRGPGAGGSRLSEEVPWRSPSKACIDRGVLSAFQRKTTQCFRSLWTSALNYSLGEFESAQVCKQSTLQAWPQARLAAQMCG